MGWGELCCHMDILFELKSSHVQHTEYSACINYVQYERRCAVQAKICSTNQAQLQYKRGCASANQAHHQTKRGRAERVGHIISTNEDVQYK